MFLDSATVPGQGDVHIPWPSAWQSNKLPLVKWSQSEYTSYQEDEEDEDEEEDTICIGISFHSDIVLLGKNEFLYTVD